MLTLLALFACETPAPPPPPEPETEPDPTAVVDGGDTPPVHYDPMCQDKPPGDPCYEAIRDRLSPYTPGGHERPDETGDEIDLPPVLRVNDEVLVVAANASNGVHLGRLVAEVPRARGDAGDAFDRSHVVDLNGDGLDDVVLTSPGGRLQVFLAKRR